MAGTYFIFLLVLLTATEITFQQTPLTIRFEKRRFQLPVDSPVNTVITRVYIIDGVSRSQNISVTLERVTSIVGPFHDAHNYFDLLKLANDRKNLQYELFLKKQLLNNFRPHDQVVLAVNAHDTRYHVKNELYGIIEDARNPKISTVATLSTYPPRSTSPTTTSTSSSTTTNTSVTEPVEAKSQPQDYSLLGLLGILVVIVPCFWWKKSPLKKICCGKCLQEKSTKDDVNEGGDNTTTVSGKISSFTEFTELTSRKTSMASHISSQYSMNSYDNHLLQTKDESDPWEFPRHHLKFYGILGEGCFGQVWKCEALNIDGRKGTTMVAVKTLKESANNKEREEFLAELKLMKMLLTEPHPNVVRLLGCCTSSSDKEPTYLILEYVAKGKLQEFLRKSRAEQYYGNLHGPSQKLTSRDLTSFCYQVSRGMEYLSSRKVVHRDLAARNILISDTNICKVADFGFSRDVMANNIYERKSEGRLPIRWMAPEALYDNVYTTKTDVWSFGVLMWEIVTLGSTPYPGMSGSEVMKQVGEGHRLDKPDHCDREIYNMMFYCWDKDPDERPTFTSLVKDLESLLTQGTDYIDLNLFPDHGYYNEVSLSGERV